MKKLSLLLAGLALVAFSFTSCKGDYVCDCVYTWSDDTTTEYSYEYTGVKKGDAEESCDAITATDGYECELN